MTSELENRRWFTSGGILIEIEPWPPTWAKPGAKITKTYYRGRASCSLDGKTYSHGGPDHDPAHPESSKDWPELLSAFNGAGKTSSVAMEIAAQTLLEWAVNNAGRRGKVYQEWAAKPETAEAMKRCGDCKIATTGRGKELVRFKLTEVSGPDASRIRE